jgi:NADPH:quinone reductase-like Zn-dependent oxidoreductase
MRVWELQNRFGLDNLALADRPAPQPGPGQARVRMTAATLNYRDLLVVGGRYNPKLRLPLVPVSDGAGVVEAVGEGVTRFRPGDRVVGVFFQGWLEGEPSAEKLATGLGADLDGVLCESRVFDEAGLLPVPDYMSDAEAAALPCAGVTAWSAIVTLSRVRPGDMVVVQGTGGVALFALQFAKLLGATVILTSSDDAKLARGRALGADHRSPSQLPDGARLVPAREGADRGARGRRGHRDRPGRHPGAIDPGRAGGRHDRDDRRGGGRGRLGRAAAARSDAPGPDAGRHAGLAR